MSNKPGKPAAESDFVHKLQEKDEDSWQSFYDQHSAVIRQRALSKGLSAAEAEEVVQETFLTLSRKIGDIVYDRSRHFRGLVGRTAGWRIEDERSRRLPDVVPPEPQENLGQTEFIAKVPDGGSFSPSDSLQNKESGELAHAVFEAMMKRVKARTSARQFEIYELHTVGGRTVEQICADLHAKPQDVYNATSRIEARLQQEVERLREEFLQAGNQGNTTILINWLKREASSSSADSRA